MKIIKRHKYNSFKVKNQSGTSLVELMISMVVGLFMLTGLVTNFISTTNAETKRVAVSEMDANAAEALRILRNSVTHAGYRTIENTILEDDMSFFIGKVNLPNVSCRNGSDRDIKTVSKNHRTRDDDHRDILTVISLADNPCISGKASCTNGSVKVNPDALNYTDCTGGGALRDAHSVSCSTDPNVGMSNPMDAKIYNSFWLRNNDKTLMCRGNRSTFGAQEIVNDVQAIQYLYGIRNDAGNVTYRKADDVTTDNQWSMVASVQVGLLMRSSNQYVLDQASTKKKYNILNQDINISESDLKRLFRVYTTTINLENRNLDALL